MLYFKKLIFALPFLLAFTLFCYKLNPFLQNTNLIFSLEMNVLIQLIFLTLLLLSSAFFFIIFATTASSNWELVTPISGLACLAPFFLLPLPQNLILAGGSLPVFIFVYFLLNRKMSSYLTFAPSTLLLPEIKHLITLILLLSSVVFYYSADVEIKQNGFKIPESLIDASLSFIPSAGGNTTVESTLPTISPEQLSLLKQNPVLVKQYGLDPAILDQINTNPQKPTSAQSLVKPMIEQQLQNIIKPYINYIPILLAVLFFFTLQFFISLASIFLGILLWFNFWILEKTGFTKYETTQREVKRLVV